MSCAPSSPGHSDFSPDGGNAGDRGRKIGRTLQWGAARRCEDCRDVRTDAATGYQCAQVRAAATDQAAERIYLKPGANNRSVLATYAGMKLEWSPKAMR